MSQIEAFIAHLSNAPELAEKLSALPSLSPEEQQAALSALAAEAGYSISAEEWHAFQNGALSDAALEKVSGGGFWDFIRFPGIQNQNKPRGGGGWL